jgi:hypothetical protein
MYITFECVKCKTVFCIPVDHYNRLVSQGKYPACVFGHRNIRELGKYGNLKESFRQDRYGKSNFKER